MISFHHKKSEFSTRKQDGAVTIAMAIILLILISLAVFTVNGSIVRETKVINSGARAQLAFEAAEAGLANAIDYFSNNPKRDVSGNIDLKSYHDMDGETADNVFTMNVGTGSVVVELCPAGSACNLNGEDQTITIISTGYSDDSTARRTISQIAFKPDPNPKLPDNPLTAMTNVAIVGSATIINPEGNTNIWSGGDIDLSSNQSKATEIPDPQGPGYPRCMETALTCSTVRSSTKLAEGSDLVQGDAKLRNSTQEELFQYYFGLPDDIYRDYVATLETTGTELNENVKDNPEHAAGQVIWVKGDAVLENTTVIGCLANNTSSCDPAVPNNPNLKPSILIIEGNVTFKGAPVFGLVYATGNVTFDSSTDIHGAVIAGGYLENKAGASLTLTYNSDVLQSTRGNGNLLPVAGSWKDFN